MVGHLHNRACTTHVVSPSHSPFTCSALTLNQDYHWQPHLGHIGELPFVMASVLTYPTVWATLWASPGLSFNLSTGTDSVRLSTCHPTSLVYSTQSPPLDTLSSAGERHPPFNSHLFCLILLHMPSTARGVAFVHSFSLNGRRCTFPSHGDHWATVSSYPRSCWPARSSVTILIHTNCGRSSPRGCSNSGR